VSVCVHERVHTSSLARMLPDEREQRGSTTLVRCRAHPSNVTSAHSRRGALEHSHALELALELQQWHQTPGHVSPAVNYEQTLSLSSLSDLFVG